MEISCAAAITLPLAEEKLQDYLHQFLQLLGYPDRTLSLYFTNDHEIQALNHRYRDQDKPTDALAWSYWEEDPDGELLGEIVISIDRIKAQAEANHLSEEEELLRLLAHSCAHVVGYDHERSPEEARQMLAIEIEMLNKVGLTNIYA